MAIPKSEATQTFTKEQEHEAVVLESIIDGKIRSDYTGSSLTITLNKYPNMKLRKAITERYREVGWRVEFGDDQREGSWVTLS